MTLQEQIARRLSGMGPDWDDIKGLEFTEAVMRRAAEIERWMEWVRRECAEAELEMDSMSEYPCGCCASVNRYPSAPLTLPPDGWKP